MSAVALVKFSLLAYLLSLSVGQACGRHLRADVPNPLEAVVERLSSDVETLKAKVEQLEEENKRRVAFTAFLSEGAALNASYNAIVPFNHAVTNAGHAFNPATGVFTCPYDGEYFFAINIDVSPDYNDRVSLMRNGVPVAYADKDDNVSTHLSSSVILSLRVGHVVTVNHHSHTGSIDRGSESTFTGFLVR